ncbi:MAG TPA: ABC transporter substrate-binding protein [Stellaceae bacterium]
MKASAAVALAALTLAVLPAGAAERTPALQQVIAAARKEGKLELQWGAGMIGNNNILKEMGDGMNAMFGTSIAVRFTPGPSEPEMLNKAMIAAAANLPSPTDILINTNQYAGEAVENKLAVPVDWLALMPDRIQPQSVEAGSTAIRTFTTLPGAIIYNTKLVPEKPTTLIDLLKPEWKGKIASTPYAAGWELMTANDVWGVDRALDFARKLSTQVAGLIRCNDLERVASGEFIAFGPNCGGRDDITMKEKGAPIDEVIPADFAAERYYYATLPKNSGDPNAAKLFVLFLESPEGQKLIWEGTQTDLHTYPDSRFAKVIDDYEKSGIKFQEFTVDWFLKHPEALDGQRRAVPILAGR